MVERTGKKRSGRRGVNFVKTFALWREGAS